MENKRIEEMTKAELITLINEYFQVLSQEGEIPIAILKEITRLENEASQMIKNLKEECTQVIDPLREKSGQEIDRLIGELQTEIHQEITRLKGEANQMIKNLTEERCQEIDSLKEKCKDTEEYITDTKKTINNLLQGATSVALASAFEHSKKSYDTSKTWLWIGFLFSIIGFLAIFFLGAEFLDINKKNPFLLFLYRYSISAPILWISYLCYSSIKEQTNLSEEYKHKSSVATAFVGFSKEFETQNSDAGKNKLIDGTLETIMRNPVPKSSKIIK